MKKLHAKTLISLVLVFTLMLSSLVGCNPSNENDVKTTTTSLGNTISYTTKTNPQDNVQITISREKNILAEGYNTVTTTEKLVAGDLITIESDYKYVYLKLTNFTGTILYLPYGVGTYQVPVVGASTKDTTAEVCGDTTAFDNANFTVECRKATDNEIKDRRVISYNPYDIALNDEIVDYTAATSTQTSSPSITNDDVYIFPHAYTNRVTDGKVVFSARNAIDGYTDTAGHWKYPYQSWGYGTSTDAEYVLYFGREVSIDQISMWLRSDLSESSGLVHDDYWKTCKLTFSDGTSTTLNFEANGNEQIFTFPTTKTSSIRISSMTSWGNPNSQGFCALTEMQVYGSDNNGNEPATIKSYTQNFGGKTLNKASSTNLHANDIATVINTVNDAFINATETTNFIVPNYNGVNMTVKADSSDWKDTVYYSGLADYYFSTGRTKDITTLRGVAQNLKYLVNGGYDTPHSDWVQAGETYLYLADYAGGAYKYKDIVRNADYCINRQDGDALPATHTGFCSSYSKKAEADWTHMSFWWCDALYMALNVYTLLYETTGNSAYIEKAYAGYNYSKNRLYNSSLNLWYRDSSKIDSNIDHADACVWSRGNAWVMAALAKQLLYLDQDKFPTIYNTYKQDFITMAEAIKGYQRADGTWNASLGANPEEEGTGKEATGTSGILYALCTGLELGILDSATYMPVVERAYNGLCSCIISVTDGGKYDNQVGYMQTTGSEASNYKNEAYTKTITHEFGMGLFILGTSAMMRLCSDYVQPSVRIIPSGR